MKVILNEYCIISCVPFTLPDKSEAVSKDMDDIHSGSRFEEEQVCASAFFKSVLMRVDERIQAIKVFEAAFLYLVSRRFSDTFKSDGAIAHCRLRWMKFFVHSGTKQGERQKKGGGVCVDKYQFM